MKVDLLVASRVLHGIVVKYIQTFKEGNKKYWNFIRFFVSSIKNDKMYKH